MSQLSSANQARVAELCDRQVQVSIVQQSRSTRQILGSIQPLNPARPKGPTVKPPPSSKDSTGSGPPSAPGKQGAATGLRKAPPPILGTNRPLAIKTQPSRTTTCSFKGTRFGSKFSANSRREHCTGIPQGNCAISPYRQDCQSKGKSTTKGSSSI